MKISTFIRNEYDRQFALNVLLKNFVDDQINNFQKTYKAWHYVSRVKEIESFALKMETGRGIDENLNLEDFFGCTIVVENYDSINTAFKSIEDHFEIVYQRPKNISHTIKSPESFIFDELRLYCKIDKTKISVQNSYSDIVFEIQIKTFLQHAWGIATHDLIYKGDILHWGMARIAYQVKAMLEHAELSIKQAGNLIQCDELNKNFEDMNKLNDILEIVKSHWEIERLPRDLKRLAENIKNLLKVIDYDLDNFKNLLEVNRLQSGHPQNLTPYGTLVQYLFNKNEIRFITHLQKKGKNKLKIFIDPSVEIPDTYDVNKFVNIVKVE